MNITSIGELLEHLASTVAPGDDRWFRGHQCESWDLTGSVFRTASGGATERVLLKRFIQEARRYVSDAPSSDWEWTFLAQHHQVPTRLLDWSENPLVALFFAAQDHFDIPGDAASVRDGKVWVLNPILLNERAGFVPTTPRDIPLFGFDDVLDNYNPFVGTAVSLPPIAGIASRTFDRITAQWGTFTVTNRGDAMNSLHGHEDYLTELIVRVGDKPTLRQQLASLGLEDRTIYPDLFRLGRRIGKVYG